jgi:cbb3-type cytochrome c oxidase subunit III
MTKSGLLAMILLVLLSPSVLGAQDIPIPESLPPGVTAAMIARGKAVFEGPGGCAACHGTDASGLLGPDLTDDQWWHAKGNYLELVNQILKGVPEEESRSGVAMLPKGGTDISEAEVQAVAAYVWRLSHPEHADSLPVGVSEEMVTLGDRVFHRAGGCAECHGADARGELGPNLTDREWLHAKGGYLSILHTIITGVAQEQSESGIVMPPRGGSQISDEDVHAVAAYIWAISRPRDGG